MLGSLATTKGEFKLTAKELFEKYTACHMKEVGPVMTYDCFLKALGEVLCCGQVNPDVIQGNVDGLVVEDFFSLMNACEKIAQSYSMNSITHAAFCTSETSLHYCSCGILDMLHELREIKSKRKKVV